MTAICVTTPAPPTRIESFALAFANAVQSLIERRMLRRSALRPRSVRGSHRGPDTDARSAAIAFGLLPR